MSFNASNPLSHLGVRAQRPPEQYLKQSRDPTPDDYQNFVIGDEWRNNNTNVWWKLCDIQGNVALWDKYAGPGTAIETITTGDSAVVVPDSNENVNFVNGNGVATTGSGSSVTFNMNSPFTGDFNFTGQVGVGSLALADSDAVSGYARVMKTGVKQLNSDGLITVLKGAQLSGMGCLSWEGPSRMHTIWFYISTSTGDTGAPMSQICQDTLNGQYVFTLFKVATDGVDMAIQCTVGNRNGGTGNAVLTWYGDAKHPVDADVTLFPASFTASSFIDTYGYYQEGTVGWPVLRGLLNATTGSPTVASIENFTYGTAGNNMGVAYELRHQQADGNQVIGSKFYTLCPDSGTNIQSTDLYFQTNLLGSLVDNARLLSTGEFDARSFGLPNLASGGWGKVIANFTINVTADGLYTIASGTRLSGIFKLAWNFPAQSRINEAVVQISTVQNDNGACLSILSNRPSQSQEVIQEFCVAVNASGIPGLQVRIGNRNGSTGNLIVTWYGDSAYPDDGTQVDLAPVGFVASAYLDYRGLQTDMNENMGGGIVQSHGLSFPADGLLAQHTLCQGVAAPANMGVGFRMDHEQADGTIVQGARLYTEATASNTNVQTTNLYVQCNYLGTLIEFLNFNPVPGSPSGDGLNIRQTSTTFDNCYFTVENLRTNGNGAWVEIRVDPTSADQDAFIRFERNGTTEYAWGIDSTDQLMKLVYGTDPTPSTGTTNMTISSTGIVHANQFLTPVAATGSSADAFFYAQGSGGAANAYLEIDLANSSGYGGIRMLNVGGAAQQWEVHALGSQNSLNLEYNNSVIFGCTSTRTLQFFGTSSNPAPEITAQARVATSDATLTTIYTITLADLEMAQAFVTIQGTRTDYSASLFGTVNAGARRSGGGAVLIGTPIVSYQEDSAGAPLIAAAVSGNNLIIQVQGVAAENWVWMSTVRYSIITE